MQFISLVNLRAFYVARLLSNKTNHPKPDEENVSVHCALSKNETRKTWW